MSDTISFGGVSLKKFSRDAKSGSAEWVANYPGKRVCNEMGWVGMPPGQVSCKLDGELHASHMILTPKENGLKKHKVAFDITSLSGFQGLRLELEGHKGKGHRLELRFHMGFVASDACEQLERFIVTCGEAKCDLQVSYVKQSEMDLTESQEATLAEHDEDFQ